PAQSRGLPSQDRRGATDHLEVPYETTGPNSRADLRNPGQMTDFSDLPNPQRRALDLVREVAAEKDCRPFLVGGPVRDLLLGRHSIDVDVTLEDGSSTLARALAKRLNGRVRSFPQFLTYKVSADGLPE